MGFKQFVREGWANDSLLDYQTRVEKGRAHESKIMDAMRSQCALNVTHASNNDDILRGIDCYLKLQGRIWSTQIKARQSHEELLFVITEDGKPGRDMKTQAEVYAFVIAGKLYLIRTLSVRKAIGDLVSVMESKGKEGKFRVDYKGANCELSFQNDPVKGTSKLMAFLPVCLFTEFFDTIIPPCDLRL